MAAAGTARATAADETAAAATDREAPGEEAASAADRETVYAGFYKVEIATVVLISHNLN